MGKPALHLTLVEPRGFCAGVVRAIDIVTTALAKYGAPVYVRHEIVHNRFVVEQLEAQGAVFVKELDEVPKDGQPVIFSAHGVPKSVPAAAQARELFYMDATCPLVSKVHREAERAHAKGQLVILVGHEGHPEVIGTRGQLPAGAVVLVESLADVEALDLPADTPLSYVTQTTLSLDDTREIIARLQARFPDIKGPSAQDICYATTNRQEAVKVVAPNCDLFLVVGAANSSNSNRLVEVALRAGAGSAQLVERARDLPWDKLSAGQKVGLSAGASAPEALIEEIIASLNTRFTLEITKAQTRREQVHFKLPAVLRHA